MESALKELRWSTFRTWVERNRGRILEACRQEALSDPEEEESLRSDDQTPLSSDGKLRFAILIMAFPPFQETKETANHVRETFKWHLRRALHPPHYRDLCWSLALPDVKDAACDFNIQEMVQATFYVMLLNDVVGLSLVSRDMAREKERQWQRKRERRPIIFPNFLSIEQAVEYVKENFFWSLRESSTLRASLLPENYHGLCPNFDHFVIMRHTHNSHIPEMTQAIFYAMVLNDPVELGLSSKIVIDYMMSVLLELNGASWEFDRAVDGMLDFRECRMAKIRLTGRLRSPDELLAQGTSEGNPCSSLGSHTSSVEVEVESTNSSASSEGVTSSSRKAVLKKRGCTYEEPVQEVVVDGMVFPEVPARSDIQDGPGTHFPSLNIVGSLTRLALEEKYLLPAGYRFVLPEADATVNKPPAKCIAMYQATFSYGVRFLLHLMIMDILNKYDLVPAQTAPTS
ncbi:hypothetical protein Cgig2_030021 [Carnegiea gigantea]|uniref:Uncharacterized protein n=1 Tax=Carnegiea gigantea TaxID=171969 RepID=A0A9Q1GQK3_9CARY|nr:hypothetical protein Cgig2_030021 [Carnegiea gigantea]